MADLVADLALPRVLAESIAAVRAKYQVADAAMLADVVSAVVSAISADVSTKQAILLREVESLGRTIAEARAEIAAIGITEITGRHIPTATDELDAVVAHTAAATDTILAACESLDALAPSLEAGASGILQGATTLIYEACSFQDITGQRIKKVVSALKAIDAKVESIVAMGQSIALQPPPSEPPSAEPLLCGPQMPAAAMVQADVDLLLADFG